MTPFLPVAPAPDGLALAFGAARRRRTGKAAVSAFGAAVAIASVLSLVAPPGQTLVQEPLPPAGHVGVVPGVDVAPHRPVPTTTTPRAAHQRAVRPAPEPAPASAPLHAPATQHGPASTLPVRTTSRTCGRAGWLACAMVHRQAAPARTTMVASMCPTAVAVSVTYESPVEPSARTVEIRSGRCGSS